MNYFKLQMLAIFSALIVSGCSFSEESLWPSLTGEDPVADPNTVSNSEKATPASTALAEAQTERSTAETSSQPALGSGNFVPAGVTPGTPTGTFVGKKVVELRDELSRLQGNISQQNSGLQKVRSQLVANSRRYHVPSQL